MKTWGILLSASVITLTSCDHPISVHTKVNEDGSLEKTIVIDKADEQLERHNIFGIDGNNQWLVKKTESYDTAKSNQEKKYRFEFYRRFEDDNKMNDVLARQVDTLFQVHAKFQKKFRWFYTYVRYSETVLPINRFKQISPKDFFTVEDSMFIRRLPAEGKPISKADSVNLISLNEKISKSYVNMGIFNELFPLLEEVVKKYDSNKKWLDTLYKKKDKIYELINEDQAENSRPEKIIKKLNIDLPPQAYKELEVRAKEFNSRLSFMSFARDGKYEFSIAMPWTIVNTNADSLNGNYVQWKPLMHKFAFTNYEMYAESRKLNLWAVIVSVIIVGLTVFVLRNKN